LFAFLASDTAVQTEGFLDSLINGADTLIDCRGYTEAKLELKLRLINELQQTQVTNVSDTQPVKSSVSELSSAKLGTAATAAADDDDDEQRTCTVKPVIAAETQALCTDEFGILTVSNISDISVYITLFIKIMLVMIVDKYYGCCCL